MQQKKTDIQSQAPSIIHFHFIAVFDTYILNQYFFKEQLQKMMKSLK